MISRALSIKISRRSATSSMVYTMHSYSKFQLMDMRLATRSLRLERSFSHLSNHTSGVCLMRVPTFVQRICCNETRNGCHVFGAGPKQLWPNGTYLELDLNSYGLMAGIWSCSQQLLHRPKKRNPTVQPFSKTSLLADVFARIAYSLMKRCNATASVSNGSASVPTGMRRCSPNSRSFWLLGSRSRQSSAYSGRVCSYGLHTYGILRPSM